MMVHRLVQAFIGLSRPSDAEIRQILSERIDDQKQDGRDCCRRYHLALSQRGRAAWRGTVPCSVAWDRQNSGIN